MQDETSFSEILERLSKIESRLDALDRDDDEIVARVNDIQSQLTDLFSNHAYDGRL